MPVALERRERERHGDAAPLLLGIEVADGVVVLDPSHPRDRAGGEQQCLGQRGLARPSVTDEGDVAQSRCRERVHRPPWLVGCAVIVGTTARTVTPQRWPDVVSHSVTRACRCEDVGRAGAAGACRGCESSGNEGDASSRDGADRGGRGAERPAGRRRAAEHARGGVGPNPNIGNQQPEHAVGAPRADDRRPRRDRGERDDVGAHRLLLGADGAAARAVLVGRDRRVRRRREPRGGCTSSRRSTTRPVGRGRPGRATTIRRRTSPTTPRSSRPRTRHYAPMGVHDWEIWNEQNRASFWLPKADPPTYTRMLKLAYPAIKQVDPHATVISGGLSPAGDNGHDMAPQTFLDAIYRARRQRFVRRGGLPPVLVALRADVRGLVEHLLPNAERARDHGALRRRREADLGNGDRVADRHRSRTR